MYRSVTTPAYALFYFSGMGVWILDNVDAYNGDCPFGGYYYGGGYDPPTGGWSSCGPYSPTITFVP
jgi:hypothetical protein